MRFALPLSTGLLLCLAGCHGKSEKLTQAPPAQLPAGWTLVSSAADGVSVGAPSGWRQGVPKMFDTSSLMGNSDSGGNPDVQQMMDNFAKEDQQAEIRKLEELRSKGILCHCVNANRPVVGEEPTRFYVKVEKQDGPISLQDAVAQEKEKMLEEGAGTSVQLANGKAWRLASTIKTRGGDDLTKIVYVLVHEDRKYALHFVSTNDPVSVEQIEKDVAQTWRIDPTKTPAFAPKGE